MILDIIVVLITLFFIIYGYRKGFVFSLIQTVGWFVALAAAYMLTPLLAPIVKDNTGFFDALSRRIEGKLDLSLNKLETLTDILPTGIQPAGAHNEDLAGSVALGIANVLGIILIFFLLFLLVKLALWLLQRLLSREYRSGFGSVFDGLLGAVFGLARGALVVLLLLIALMPVSTLFSTGIAEFLTAQLDSSIFTGYVYENNPIIMLMQGYMDS